MRTARIIAALACLGLLVASAPASGKAPEANRRAFSCYVRGVDWSADYTPSAAGAGAQGVGFNLVERAATLGMAEPDTVSRGVAIADYDHDGAEDLAVARSTGGLMIYRNRGDGTFARRDVELGITYQRGEEYPWGVTWGDYDNDGDPDLFVGVGGFFETIRNKLYRNDVNTSGTFTEVTGAAGVGGFGEAAWGGTWADYDNDGWLDLYVSYTYRDGQLLHNNGNGTFTDVSNAANVQTPMPENGRGKNPLWFDADRDGWLDLYVVRNIFAEEETRVESVFYQNNGNGTFTERAAAVGLENLPDSGPWQSMSDDYNLDGWPDIWVPGFSGYSALYINQKNGTFKDVAASAGVRTRFFTMGPQTGDFDNDGSIDLMQGGGKPTPEGASPRILWRNQLTSPGGSLRFADQSVASGIRDDPDRRAHGAAFFDYDRDGDLDIYIANGGNDALGDDQLEPSYFYRNDGGNSKNWINIGTIGTVSNRDGVGATVMVTAPGRGARFYARTAGQGFVSNNSPIIHAGLGNATQADIEVYWPASGLYQTWFGVNEGADRVVEEPDPDVSPTLTSVSSNRNLQGIHFTLRGSRFEDNPKIIISKPGDATTVDRVSTLGGNVSDDGTTITFTISGSPGTYGFRVRNNLDGATTKKLATRVL